MIFWISLDVLESQETPSAEGIDPQLYFILFIYSYSFDCWTFLWKYFFLR